MTAAGDEGPPLQGRTGPVRARALDPDWHARMSSSILRPSLSRQNLGPSTDSMPAPRIHATADVHPSALIGDDAQLWHYVQVREGARVGARCILGRGAYVDAGVIIGDDCKLQNYVCTYHGVTLGGGVFVGPHACFTNDLVPRAIRPDGKIKGADDWETSKTFVGYGASIGANATIVCGLAIGRWALVAAGAVVTKSVPDYGLVRGNPARLVGFVTAAGEKVDTKGATREGDVMWARALRSGERVGIPVADWARFKGEAV
jgi:UDP-2-acetamido-3-amino-2,3-dideoxy-glucuronate N-acetyltransferase